MNCKEFREWLTNKDGFDEHATVRAENHRESCKACDRLSMLDAQLESQIEVGLKKVDPPERLLARIEMNLQPASEDRFLARISWKILVPAVAIAAVLVFFLNPFAGRVRSVQELGILAVKNHLSNLPMTFKAGDVGNVPHWFEDRLGFTITVPELTEQNLQFLGGRKCHLGKNDAAYLIYEKAEARASLFIIEPDDVGFEMKNAETCFLSEQGYEVKVWKEAELFYVLVE